MDRTQQKLLNLLQCALWGNSCNTISADDLIKVMTLAKEHAVDGLVVGVFIDNKVQLMVSPEVEDLMMDLVAKDTLYKRTYARHCSGIVALQALMSANKIPYIVFKGTAVASHYSKPYQRTMGDVDFYVQPQDFERTIGVLESNWKVKLEDGDSEKHFSFIYNDIPFELHHRVETFGSTRHQLLFDKWINNGVEHVVKYNVDGGSADMLPPEEDTITVFKHMFNHLLVEGVGLRQVVDVAVLLNDYQDDVDIATLREMLSKSGYINAFDATVVMLRDYLGLPCASRYTKITEKNHRWGKKIMDFVMESGNFGRSAYKNKSAGLARSAETASHAFRHVFSLAPLIPSEVLGLVWKHGFITIRKHLNK